MRDPGKFWFVTLRMIYVTYVTVNSGNPLLQECYTSHMVVLHIQILQSGKPVMHQRYIHDIDLYSVSNFVSSIFEIFHMLVLHI